MPTELKKSFFSYHREDFGKLQSILTLLPTIESVLGEPEILWHDKNIPADAPDWREVVGKQIVESFFFVLLLTHDTKISKEVRKECQFAIQHDRHIIVLYWNEDPDARPDLPEWLGRNRQVIEVSSNTLIQQVKELAAILVGKRSIQRRRSSGYNNLYVASLFNGVGKTSIIAGLNPALFGGSAGYFKVFIEARRQSGRAYYVPHPMADVVSIQQLFRLPIPPENLYGEDLDALFKSRSEQEALERIGERFQTVRDHYSQPILIEGTLDLHHIDVSLYQLLKKLQSRLVIILTPGDYRSLMALQTILEDIHRDAYPVGVVVNEPWPVDEKDDEYLTWYHQYEVSVEDERVVDLGYLRYAPQLRGVRLSVVAKEIDGEFKYPTGGQTEAQDQLGNNLIWDVELGAWEHDPLIEHFKKVGHRGMVVVTGADRSADVLLDLITETDVGALILTGHWRERKFVLRAAEEFERPIIFTHASSARTTKTIEDMIRFGVFDPTDNVKWIEDSLKNYKDQWIQVARK